MEEHSDDPPQALNTRSLPVRIGWTVLGFGCLGLGALGVLLPGLPTTPFVILAAACFARSSQRLYERLLRSKTFGPLIRDYREGRGVPARAKAWALGMMWLFVAFALGPGMPRRFIWPRIVVAAAAVIGTAYLLRLPARAADFDSSESSSEEKREEA